MLAMYLQTPFVWGGAETTMIMASGQDPVTFEEVAVHFTDEEWEWLDPDQKALHREVTEEICWLLYTLETDYEQHHENNPGLSAEPFERIDYEAGKERLQTLNRKEMSTAKKAQLKTDSGRSFQEAWTESFGMTEHNGKALCILCSRSVVSRTSSVRRHFETNHKSVAKLGEVERKEFLEGQLRKYHSQELSFCNYLSKTNQLTADSFQISLCLAKHGKPLSDGDFIKTAMLAGSNSLFHDFPNKDKIMQRISEMPLIRNTVKDQVLRMASDVSQQLTADLQEAACYSMCLDESTDINNHAML